MPHHARSARSSSTPQHLMSFPARRKNTQSSSGILLIPITPGPPVRVLQPATPASSCSRSCLLSQPLLPLCSQANLNVRMTPVRAPLSSAPGTRTCREQGMFSITTPMGYSIYHLRTYRLDIRLTISVGKVRLGSVQEQNLRTRNRTSRSVQQIC